jgi:hypothetical protein
VYGRRTYEITRYWDTDLPEWDAEELDFAAAWRSQPKWVVSRSLKSVGPNATLVQNDVGTVIRELKARLVGEIDVAGPDLARSLTDLGLILKLPMFLLEARTFLLSNATRPTDCADASGSLWINPRHTNPPILSLHFPSILGQQFEIAKLVR